MLEFVYFFFFQAEDGIRDLIVTGVQTCALPIWPPGGREARCGSLFPASGCHQCGAMGAGCRSIGQPVWTARHFGEQRRNRQDGPLRGSSLADWQQVIDVNLTGAYLGMRYAIEPMIAGGGGSIINISSVEGLAGSAHLHAYVAAKFGLRGITKSAAVELASHNIRVNSIHPGLVHTPLSQGVTEAFMAPIPMRRGASPEDISQFVVFLASDESAYATGAEFVVDGGLTSYVPVKM